MNDARKRTLYTLSLIQPGDLDVPPIAGLNTIGMLLYHMTLVDLRKIL